MVTPTPTLIPRPTPTPDPSAPIYGPIAGVLIEDQELIETFGGFRPPDDVMVEATFINPYSPSKGRWSYGFMLRWTQVNTFHAIVLESSGLWGHDLRLGDDSTLDIRSELSASIDTTAGGKNRLRVVMIGNEGWLFINEAFVGKLDLSGLTETGSVAVLAGYYGSGITGESTRFEDFIIWKWHPELATLPKTD